MVRDGCLFFTTVFLSFYANSSGTSQTPARLPGEKMIARQVKKRETLAISCRPPASSVLSQWDVSETEGKIVSCNHSSRDNPAYPGNPGRRDIRGSHIASCYSPPLLSGASTGLI